MLSPREWEGCGAEENDVWNLFRRLMIFTAQWTHDVNPKRTMERTKRSIHTHGVMRLKYDASSHNLAKKFEKVLASPAVHGTRLHVTLP